MAKEMFDEGDVRGSYQDVTKSARAKDAAFAVLQRIARAYLKWDKYAAKQDRNDLKRFADMPLSDDNCTWFTEQAFRDMFRIVFTSSMQGEQDRNGSIEGENQYVRTAFAQAIQIGASDYDVKQVLSALDEVEAAGRKAGTPHDAGKTQ